MENVLGEILSGFRFSYKKNFKKQTGSWMQTYGTGGNLGCRHWPTPFYLPHRFLKYKL